MSKLIRGLHRKAVNLCEGGIVLIKGLWVRAVRIPNEANACQICEMDSACDEEMCSLCAECDDYDRHKHILCMNSNKRRVTNPKPSRYV